MKTNWIPVSERLPDKCGNYLVFNKANEIHISYFDKECETWINDYGFQETKTHWQELPQPPK